MKLIKLNSRKIKVPALIFIIFFLSCQSPRHFFKTTSSQFKFADKNPYPDSLLMNINRVLLDTLGFKAVIKGSEGINSFNGKILLFEPLGVHILYTNNFSKSAAKVFHDYTEKISKLLPDYRLTYLLNEINRYLLKSNRKHYEL